jgi:thioredoxin-dependent peroxiredoxin
MAKLTVGDTAPDFSLRDQTGKTVTLRDFRGQKLVLYFYPKDNTSGCTKEACAFQENLGVLRKKGVAVVGVSADNVTSHEKFANKYGLEFPLLSDEKKEMIKAYHVWKKKSMYGKEYMGIERTTYVIDEKGKIMHIFPKVNVNGHVDVVNQVLEAQPED